jgi:4-aminobutyrate--pyruvate transaminase
VLFCSSGSEANDMQIKLSGYAANARGEPARKKIISRRGAYHGVTAAAGSLTGLPFVQEGFDLPVNERFLYARAPYHYREAEPGESEEDFSARLAAELEELILREGPESIAMYIAEPVMGAGGVITPPKGYFPAIGRVLEKYGIRFVSDEVICGFGRTGEWFGCETYGARPASISVAKALTSAYVPLGAVTVEEEMYEALREESARRGVFGHGFTYTGHPVACAVALKAIEIYEREDMPAQVKRKAALFERRFAALAAHPLVGDVRAKGLVGAVELVADKASKRPFSPAVGIGAKVSALAEEQGLIPRAVAGHNIALCPPLIISEEEMDEMFDRLERALDEAEELARREGWREA